MTQPSRVSIITPSWNERIHLSATIQSLRAQKYADLEHVVVDCGSTDGTLGMLAGAPDVRVVACDRAGPRGAAVNQGFREATGSILGYLEPGDILVPNALQCVASEMASSGQHSLVVGRCELLDEDGRETGIEYSCRLRGARDVLEIWNVGRVPRAATFWTREAWDVCGPMDASLPSGWIHYDWICRVARRFAIQVVDRVIAAEPLRRGDDDVWTATPELVASGTSISRRYWPSPLHPEHWSLAWSLAWHTFDRRGRARRLIARGTDEWRHQRRWQAIWHVAAGAFLAPEVGFHVIGYPKLRGWATSLARNALSRFTPAHVAPKLVSHLHETGTWDDGWVGPLMVVPLESKGTIRALRVRGCVNAQQVRLPLTVAAYVDGTDVGVRTIKAEGAFDLCWPIAQSLPEGVHAVSLHSDSWFVPMEQTRSDDPRRLSWRLTDLTWQSDTGT